jgi:hypothetical protein
MRKPAAETVAQTKQPRTRVRKVSRARRTGRETVIAASFIPHPRLEFESFLDAEVQRLELRVAFASLGK